MKRRQPSSLLTRRSALSLLATSLVACSQEPAVHKDEHDALKRFDPQGAIPDTFRIGITPSSGEDTGKRLLPLVAYLAGKLDLDVKSVTAASYPALAQMVEDREVEVGIFSPAAYVTARRNMNGVAIATATRLGSPTYLGYLVVLKPDVEPGDAPDPPPLIEDMAGKRVAWVNKSSTSGYHYPRAMLRSKGIDPDDFFGEQIFALDHEKAATMVIEGRADVAAVASAFADPGTATTVPGANRLLAIAKTSRIPLDCVVVHTRLQRALAMKLRAALLDLNTHEAGERLVTSWGVDGFVKPLHERYNDIEEILEGRDVG